ncbi:hypothetical protein TRFO_35385 [Tritrichomonas foetus]|uniref:Uncharacterized protein n=1 Tax=Tritrichomonas foetus TaxID=1144522 RepID=A0A1J4JL09_9EUKA|nr:hypothetical protein TRFO_35385 [Tritrichomonas foetus]|eukprot:OHS98259.1 hypothetical protein TRFO_35385 [Tritrichomonas foetus]
MEPMNKFQKIRKIISKIPKLITIKQVLTQNKNHYEELFADSQNMLSEYFNNKQNEKEETRETFSDSKEEIFPTKTVEIAKDSPIHDSSMTIQRLPNFKHCNYQSNEDGQIEKLFDPIPLPYILYVPPNEELSQLIFGAFC